MLVFFTRSVFKAVMAVSLLLGAAVPSAHAAAPALAHSAPKTVLVLGDSLSAEYGLSRGAGWVALMENRLKLDRIDSRIVNASISGETTSGGRTRLPALLAEYKPAMVIIELGANDGLRGLPVPAAEANLRAMVTMAQQDKAKVVLVGMRMPPNYGRAYTDSFFAMYKKVAGDMKTALVPFMLEGIAEKPELFQADRLHPAAQAHPTILKNIYPTLLPLFKAH